MKPDVVIRAETADDVYAIEQVTVSAFETLEISDKTEQFIIAGLRAAGALTLSLVAEAPGGRVVGHIAFSPIEVSDASEGWYGLGPLSVQPEYQRRGIGSALIEEGSARLKALGAQGCCLVGHPGYYGRFGFDNPRGLGLPGVPAEAFFALAFSGPVPQGEVRFHEAFMTAGATARGSLPQGE
jgi:putative acetyltransferase